MSNHSTVRSLQAAINHLMAGVLDKTTEEFLIPMQTIVMDDALVWKILDSNTGTRFWVLTFEDLGGGCHARDLFEEEIEDLPTWAWGAEALLTQ